MNQDAPAQRTPPGSIQGETGRGRIENLQDPGTIDPSQDSTNPTLQHSIPSIPDHELLRRIGGGSYGEVWLARNVLGEFRAVKVIYRDKFEHDRPFEREFEGIQKFEPISRLHESQVEDDRKTGRNTLFVVTQALDRPACLMTAVIAGALYH